MPTYNAAPSQVMPVITEHGLEYMRWGVVPHWAKNENIGYRLFNARSETVFDRPMWKHIILRHRCLVPANGFYEWQQRDDGKHPYYIHPRGQDLFAFAGIWETWEHDHRPWYTFTILTTESNAEMTAIHDRMPVILHPEDEAQWLAADTRQDLEPLLVPYPDGGLEIYEVSKAINLARTQNDKALIMPVSTR